MHYCVDNMPGAVPRTSTLALTNSTLPYALKIANLGYREAMKGNPAIARGMNLIYGEVVHKAGGGEHGYQICTPIPVLEMG